MAVNPISKYQAPAKYTLKYADIDDDNAIVTALATSLTASTVTGAGLNGVMANPGPALTKMHRLSVKTSAVAACYNTTDAITATCTDQQGNARTLVATLATAGGGETIEFALADGTDAGALTVTSIAIPAQLKNSGQFEFGVTDVVFDDAPLELRVGAAGDVAVNYTMESSSGVPVADVLTGVEGERFKVGVKRILDTGTDGFPVTAFISVAG